MSRFNLRTTQVLTRTDGGKLAAASGQKASSSRSSCSRPFCTQCHFDIEPSEGMHVGDRQGHPFLAGTAAPYLAAFRKGLVKTGFLEGHNAERLAELAADLVLRRVAVIARRTGQVVR